MRKEWHSLVETEAPCQGLAGMEGLLLLHHLRRWDCSWYPLALKVIESGCFLLTVHNRLKHYWNRSGKKWYEAWNNITWAEVNAPVLRSTATFVSNGVTLVRGSFLRTVLLMDLAPQAGSPEAETFPGDTREQRSAARCIWSECLVFDRLLGYLM